MFSKHSKEHGKRKLPKTPCFKEKFYLPKLQKTLPFTEYPTGEESFEKNVADVAVDKVFKLRTDRLIDRQQIPNGISEENLLRFLSYYNDVNPIWLLTGEGEILLTKTPKIPVKSRIPER